ncbi:chemotaxis protein CheX [Pleionea sp. CnH1-48]|uniref:chemotaxis protein CheX n=1 Tax=Pleionea sp. CnH1-48 TaxID=2954494 RepID=UPI0020986792|nr:chemotaxis protein CheX [Pleionea sp. CnH1-48]MCO7226320.1 chemotaxis protein CheX [Pleionea sp. CnH1-48]
MESENEIKSKILVFESDASAEGKIKSFCEEHSIITLKASKKDPMNILKTNTDLGGIIVSDEFESDGLNGNEFAKKIHESRPELPIFMRLSDVSAPLEKSAIDFDHHIASQFNIDRLDALKDSIDNHLFTIYYPMPLVRVLQELSLDAIHASVKDCEIHCDAPYLVKDQLIYGELFSLIPLESNWYRGYMMLQTTESEISSLIEHGKTSLHEDQNNFRYVSSLLSEVTNLVWGGLKNRFKMDTDDSHVLSRTQVPISVNHSHKFISFGTNEPQLCIHFRLTDKNGVCPSIDLYQKLIFNLSYYPENFLDCDTKTEELIDSGELEFF